MESSQAEFYSYCLPAVAGQLQQWGRCKKVTYRRQQVLRICHMGSIPRLTEIVPRGELARVCGKSTVQIGAYIARWPRKGRDHVGLAGRGHSSITSERGLGWGTRRRETQLVEALTQSVFESHDE